MTPARSILLVGPSWVGDMVMCHSLVRQLKSVPGTEITVLAPSWTLPVLARMRGVDHSIELPFKHGELNMSGRYHLAKSLREYHFSLALVLPGSWKSALIPWLAGIPHRIGYVGEQRWLLLTEPRRLNKTALPKTVQRFTALSAPACDPIPKLGDLPWPQLQSSATTQRETLQAVGIAAPQQAVLGLCPGAEYGPSKQWPAHHFSSVADEFSKRGWLIWLFGSSRDAAFAQQIIGLSKAPLVNLCGSTSLLQALDLLALCSAVISNDSGLMHIAAALQRPLVALYGSSSPDTTPPLCKQSRILYQAIDCSPCFQRHCPLQHHRCMQELAPELVVSALDQVTESVTYAPAGH